ncbi:MAG: hypothetical protein IPJ18_09215 [Betaproteobacteria bacterium]|nr:hypothetical protein [Betaproteobacteria bacterium]
MSRLSSVLASPAVWRADQLSEAAGDSTAVCSTGFMTLNDYFPGGGWPLGVMVEVLQAQASHHDWQLLMPALSVLCAAKPVLLVGAASRFVQPFIPGLAACGLSAQRLLWVDCQDPAAQLGVAEQGLRCASMAAVLAWLPQDSHHARLASPALGRANARACSVCIPPLSRSAGCKSGTAACDAGTTLCRQCRGDGHAPAHP